MLTTDPGLAWVVGSGGLLGRAVVLEAERAGRAVHRSHVPWHDTASAVSRLATDAASLLTGNRHFEVFWCAGAGVVGSNSEDLNREVAILRGFLGELAGLLETSPVTTVSLFLASSAGGVYAGSTGPPFTEETEPHPVSPYGEAKLASEQLVHEFCASTGARALIGRIANLYGPGQDVTKPQGLISQLCRSQLERQPIMIYVSLDTARDYIFAPDAGRMVVAGASALGRSSPGTVVTKIIASQSATTVAMILGELRRITKHFPRVVMGTSPFARFQTRDLRFRSVQWPELDRFASTPLPAGVSATLASLSLDMRAARLADSRPGTG